MFEASNFLQQWRRTQQLPLRADGGRLDGVECTITKCVKYFRDVTGDRRSHDEDWAGRLPHDLSSGFDPVDARHDHVHEDQIGPVATGERNRLAAAEGSPGHLVTSARHNRAAEGLAGQLQVVDDRNPHSIASPIKSETVSRNFWS